MEIKINDKSVTVPEGTTLQGALNLSGIAPDGIATGLNGNVIPMIERDTTELYEGDSIIIIKPFYGG